MWPIIVAAIVGTAVGAFTTASLKWGRTALAVAEARLRRDHRSLHGGGNWMLPQSVSSGQPCSVRLLIACAPCGVQRDSIFPAAGFGGVRAGFAAGFKIRCFPSTDGVLRGSRGSIGDFHPCHRSTRYTRVLLWPSDRTRRVSGGSPWKRSVWPARSLPSIWAVRGSGLVRRL